MTPADPGPGWQIIRRSFDWISGLLLGELALAVVASLALIADRHALDGLPFPARIAVAFGPLALLGITTFFAARTGPVAIRVGADGFAIRRGRSERFVPYGDVRTIETRADGAIGGPRSARIVLRSGEVVRVAGAPPAPKESRDATEARVLSLEATIDRLITAHQDHGRPEREPLPDGVAASAAELATWRPRGAADFRHAAPDRERLLEVAADPRAPAIARATAAATLGTLSEPERVRLRVAAEETASPKVRVVLEAAADETQTADAVERLARALR